MSDRDTLRLLTLCAYGKCLCEKTCCQNGVPVSMFRGTIFNPAAEVLIGHGESAQLACPSVEREFVLGIAADGPCLLGVRIAWGFAAFEACAFFPEVSPAAFHAASASGVPIESEVGNRALRAQAFVEDDERVIDGAGFLRSTQTHDGIDEKEALRGVLRASFLR